MKFFKVGNSIRIQNIVANVKIGQQIDLNQIVRGNPLVEYNPKKFPGLIYKLKKPRITLLIFSSGKMVCTGGRSAKEAKKGVKKVFRELQRVGIIFLKKPEIEIVNIVASACLGGMIDIEKCAVLLDNVMYEPDQFPGLIYRMDDPKVVFLLFTTGKLVCTGAKKEESVYNAVERLNQDLQRKNLLYSDSG